MICCTRSGRAFAAIVLVASTCLVSGPTHPNTALVGHSPGAPSQLAQFEFLLGIHECKDVFTNLDGKRETLPSTWTGEYILGGLGIQDRYANARFHSTSIRTFDPQLNRWRVTYFREPGGITGVWEGGGDSNQLVLERTFKYNGQPTLSRLIFDLMTADSFRWRSEYHSDERVFVDWTSDCRRVAQ